MEIVEEIKKAVEHTKKNEFKEAETIYLNLLKRYPENHSVLSFLGLLYYNKRKYKKAEKYLLKSYNISPSAAIVYYIGMAKFMLFKYKTAVDFLELALINDKSMKVYKPLIASCTGSRMFIKGYQYALDAQKLFPLDERILEELSYSALKTGKFKECEKYSKVLLKLNPTSSQAWFNFGLMEEILYGNEKKARECYRKMIKFGDKENGYLNLAVSYSKNPETRKKSYYYLYKVKKRNSQGLKFNFLFATHFLSNRQFKAGYKYYIHPDMESQDDVDWFSRFKNHWKGGSFKDETLLVYGDQGFGDQIQFCRYLPFLEKRFKSIKVVVPECLYDILKNTFVGLKKTSFYKRTDSLPMYDKSTMMSWVIYYLNKSFKNIPCSSGYLKSNPDKVYYYREKYFKSKKPKIGICWEAGAAGVREHIHRTLNVELFEPIIKIKTADVFSFQVKPTLDNYKKYSELIDVATSFNSFEDTAAALKNLDVLITVDTAIAHLAGALGVKTFLILPYCPDWRWFDNTEKTEWYDSIRIFKQKHHDDWNNVFESILNALNNSV